MDTERDPESSAHNGGDAVCDALSWAGVEVVFGIPSVHNLPVYDALARRGDIRVVTVRHEESAAGAADGYARSSGKLGAFLTSTGPGAANAMGGQLEAFVSGSPVIHLTGQIETQYLDKGRGFIHEVPDQPAMLASLSKEVLRARSTDEIAETVAKAATIALTAPQGPVAVELPIDLLYARARPFVPASDVGECVVPRPVGPQDEAAEMIASSRRPLIWAGGGAVRSGAEKEVAELARLVGAGVLTSPNARGILPEDDPLSIGNLAWDRNVRQLVAEADLLIAIGTRYQGPNTENWKMELTSRLLQIDVEPDRPARSYEAALSVKGDARLVLAGVLSLLEESSLAGPEPAWTDRVAEVSQSAREHLRSSVGGQAAFLDELQGSIGDDTVVVKDSTIPAYTWGNRLLRAGRTRRSIMANSFAIGLGLPHALGAAAATGSPAVLIAGDGGFMLSAAELATIAAEELAVTVALFNDGGYGILRNIQDHQYGRRIGVDLGRPDFCGLARSLGVEAEKVADSASFGKAVRSGLSSKRPYLVEVDLDKVAPMKRPYTGTTKPALKAGER